MAVFLVRIHVDCLPVATPNTTISAEDIFVNAVIIEQPIARPFTYADVPGAVAAAPLRDVRLNISNNLLICG